MLWHRPEVLAAIRQHVPAERIDPRILTFSLRRESRRTRRLLRKALILAAASMLVVLIVVVLGLRRMPGFAENVLMELCDSFGLVDSWGWARYYVTVLGGHVVWVTLSLFCMLVVFLFMAARVQQEKRLAGSVLCGLVGCSGTAMLPATCAADVWGHPPIETGVLGAGAGILLYVAVFCLRTLRPVRWRHVLGCVLLGFLGFSGGWYGYGGIESSAVCEGWVGGFSRMWTPAGDAFIVSDYPMGKSAKGVRWFSADLTPGRAFPLPRYSFVRAVGDRATLCQVLAGSEEGANAELWFLPRDEGEPRRLLSGPNSSYGRIDLSPDCKRAIVRERRWQEDKGDEGEAYDTFWYVADMIDGTVRPVARPLAQTVLEADTSDHSAPVPAQRGHTERRYTDLVEGLDVGP